MCAPFYRGSRDPTIEEPPPALCTALPAPLPPVKLHYLISHKMFASNECVLSVHLTSRHCWMSKSEIPMLCNWWFDVNGRVPFPGNFFCWFPSTTMFWVTQVKTDEFPYEYNGTHLFFNKWEWFVSVWVYFPVVSGVRKKRFNFLAKFDGGWTERLEIKMWSEEVVYSFILHRTLLKTLWNVLHARKACL